MGPGKIRLLELINETGSISAAGRALAMSYRQAWLLVDEINQHVQGSRRQRPDRRRRRRRHGR